MKKESHGNAEKEKRDAVIVFRCTKAEKSSLVQRALRNGEPFAKTLRAALGLEEAHRHKGPIEIDPHVVRALSQLSINLSMVARSFTASICSSASSTGPTLELLAHLISIDRSMQGIHAHVVKHAG